jgi:hypothetical protein
MDWIHLAQDRGQRQVLVNTVMNLPVPWKAGNFVTSWVPISFSRMILLHRVGYNFTCLFCMGLKSGLSRTTLRVCKNRVLRRIFEPKRGEVTRGGRKQHNEMLHNLCCSLNINVDEPLQPFVWLCRGSSIWNAPGLTILNTFRSLYWLGYVRGRAALETSRVSQASDNVKRIYCCQGSAWSHYYCAVYMNGDVDAVLLRFVLTPNDYEALSVKLKDYHELWGVETNSNRNGRGLFKTHSDGPLLEGAK